MSHVTPFLWAISTINAEENTEKKNSLKHELTWWKVSLEESEKKCHNPDRETDSKSFSLEEFASVKVTVGVKKKDRM